MAMRIGVDVGGTNTDAALLSATSEVLATAKATTTKDIVTGVVNSIKCIRQQVSSFQGLSAVMIGTTQFVNAVIQQRGLSRVLVVRLCGTSTAALPPWVNIPQQLARNISAGYIMAKGGYEYNGREISSLSPADVSAAADLVVQRGAAAVVVCGVHAPINPEQELQFGQQLRAKLQSQAPGLCVQITLSHKLSGRLGLLEREAAAILNASLQPLAAAVIPSYSAALKQLGLQHVPLYLTGNDGTLMAAAMAQEYPVLTFRSGPVNSVRGAAYLAGLKDALVVDVGGTTTDVGMVVQGMPRMCGAFVDVCGVLTNFRMPDVTSFGLGGGSLVTWEAGSPSEQRQHQRCRVGPLSVGSTLTEKSLVCGGNTLTASDVAVLLYDRIPGLAHRQQAVETVTLDRLDLDRLRTAWEFMQQKLTAAVDAAKTSADAVPLIVVGGGSGLCGDHLSGVSQIIRPDHAAVANAVGAAIPQVAGTVDTLLHLTDATRQQLLAAAVHQATAAAVAAGADQDTCEVVEQEEIPVAYGPAGSSHVHIKAVGQLKLQEIHAHSAATAAAEPPETSGVGGLTAAAAAAAPTLIAAAVRPAEQVSGLQDQQQWQELSSPTTGSTIGTSSQLPSTHSLSELQQYTPKITVQGLWEISSLDIDAIAIGAQILGAGGGGSASHNRLKLLHAMTRRWHSTDRLHDSAAADQPAATAADQPETPSTLHSSSSSSMRVPMIMALEDLPDDAYVCDVGGMGAPTVSAEKLDNYECSAAVQALSEVLPQPITALIVAEVGGGNALEPLAVGLKRGLPVVDADLMGRAFPELQMNTAAIAGVSLTPAAVSDDKGNTLVMTSAASPDWAERVLRAACTEMGCSVGLASTPMSGKTAKQVVVPGSLSLAWHLGVSVMTSQAAKSDPVAGILQLYQGTGKLLYSGKVTDVVRHTEEGFVRGFVCVSSRIQPGAAVSGTSSNKTELSSSMTAMQGVADLKSNEAATTTGPVVAGKPGGDLMIEFQNENLIAKDASGQVLACVPDLICILESSSGLAVATEEIRYGLWVSVLVLPAHPLLRTPAALQVVGPTAFGYPADKVTYQPVGDFPTMLSVHNSVHS